MKTAKRLLALIIVFTALILLVGSLSSCSQEITPARMDLTQQCIREAGKQKYTARLTFPWTDSRTKRKIATQKKMRRWAKKHN